MVYDIDYILELKCNIYNVVVIYTLRLSND